MKIDHRTRHVILDVGMKASIVGLLAIAFLTFIDGRFIFRPLSVEHQFEIKTLKDEYKTGEIVQGYFTFCKKRNIEGTVQWYLVDGSLVTFPSRTSNVQRGCYKNKVIDIERIPSNVDMMASEFMHFEGRVTYKMNGFNKILVDMKTTPFKVIE